MIKQNILNFLFVLVLVQFNFNSIQAAVIDEQVEKIEECSICTVGLDQGKTCECTNGHEFHYDCMKRWFEGKTSSYRRCPVCRVHFELSASQPIAQAINQPINVQPVPAVQEEQVHENTDLINLIIRLSLEDRNRILAQLLERENRRISRLLNPNIINIDTRNFIIQNHNNFDNYIIRR